MSARQPVSITEAITRWGLRTQEGGRKRCANFARTKDPTYIAPYGDAYQDQKGQWWLIPSGDPPLEVEVEDGGGPPAPLPQRQVEELLQAVGGSLQALHEQREADRKLIEQQGQQLERLEAVVGSLHQGQPSRDQWIVQQMREMLAEKQKQKPWWKRMMRR